MTRKQHKALRRSKAIKKKQNILRIKNRATFAAAVAVASAAIAAPNISAQDTSAQAMIEEMRSTEEGEAFYQRQQEAFSEAISPEEN